jgi:hypothetical protein
MTCLRFQGHGRCRRSGCASNVNTTYRNSTHTGPGGAAMVDPGSKVCIYTMSPTHLVADIGGWFQP